MNQLEELARRSAEAAHDSTRRLPVPEMSPTSRRRPLLLLAAAIAVVAGLAIVLTDQPSEDTTETITEPPEVDAPESVAGAAPHLDLNAGVFGLRLHSVIEIPANTGASPHAWVYRDDETDVMILMTSRDDYALDPLAGSDPIMVRGKEAVVDAELDAEGFTAVAWFEEPNLPVVIASRVLNVERLAAIAESLDLADGGANLPDELDGLPIVAADAPLGLDAEADGGWLSVYLPLSQDDAGTRLVLSASPTGGGTLELLHHLYGGERVDVRDTEGVLLFGDGTLYWEESSTIYSITASGVDAIEAANDLFPMSDEAWAEELLVSRLIQAADPDGLNIWEPLVGRWGGQETTSLAVSVIGAPGRELCVRVQNSGPTVEHCFETDEDAPVSIRSVEVDGETVVFGFINETVDSLQFLGESLQLATITNNADFPDHRRWMTVLETDTASAWERHGALEAIDADGDVIAEVDWRN